jgi:outer membrane protein assembly factor BamB
MAIRKQRSGRLLHVGLAPRVLALDADTGDVVWATKIPRAATLVTIRIDGDRVYAGTQGEVACLDAASGKILWQNRLKGMGLNTVIFASEPGAAATVLAAQAAAAGAATTSAS